MTTLFFDRTFGKRLPHALRLLGVAAEAHQDHFAQDAPDDEWLAAVSARGWIVLTNDKRIRFNQAERQALLTHGVGCFVFTSGSRTRWDQLRILGRAWDRIQEAIETTPRPFIYSVHADSSLTLLLGGAAGA